MMGPYRYPSLLKRDMKCTLFWILGESWKTVKHIWKKGERRVGARPEDSHQELVAGWYASD